MEPDKQNSTGTESVSTEPPTITSNTPKPSFSVAESPNKKRNLIIAGVAGILLLAGGGVGYTYWYQNPDKVMVDAVTNLISSKKGKINGTVAINTEEIDVDIALKGSGNEENSGGSADITFNFKATQFKDFGKLTLTGDAIFANNGDLYFKVKSLKPAIDKLIDFSLDNAMQYSDHDELDRQTIRNQLSQYAEPVVNKIEDQWIKVTAKDRENDTSKAQNCVIDTLSELQTEPALRKEMTKIYKDNRFIIVDKHLQHTSSDFGYQLKFDESAANSFGEALKDSELGKKLIKCDEDFFNVDISNAPKDDFDMSVELWVNKWSHNISKLKVNASSNKEKASFLTDINFELGKSDDITIPSDTKSIEELNKEIGALMVPLMGAASPAVY